MVKSDSVGLDMIVALSLVSVIVAIVVFLLWLATGRHGGVSAEIACGSYNPNEDDDRWDFDRRSGLSSNP